MKSKINIRHIEFGLVFLIAIVPLLTLSLFSVAKKFPEIDPVLIDLQVISAIFLLFYVFFRQNRSLRELGLSFTKIDFPHSWADTHNARILKKTHAKMPVFALIDKNAVFV